MVTFGEKSRVCCVVGTRPEAIKMAPVVMALRQRPWADVRVLATGQHRSLLDQAMRSFGIEIDDDLDVMEPDQSLASLTARLLLRADGYLAREKPDFVLAQGDTTTVLATAVACFYRRVPFGHVEAGLRTFDTGNPFPEEFNRVVTSLATRLHFAPTESARRNLLNEGVSDPVISVTGNTVIDALLWMRDRRPEPPFQFAPGAQVVLLTTHRRENLGDPMRGIFAAVRSLLERFPRLEFVYPVHPNPNVRKLAYATLRAEERVHLCEPLSYEDLVATLTRADLVLTDSGGLQEEAPALGKPVLVLRTETERPEAVDQGVVKLVGTDANAIVREVARLLTDPRHYRSMAKHVSPYGDGQAARRICDVLEAHLMQADQASSTQPSARHFGSARVA